MTGYGLPYDQLPADVRRANWGWFGPPWPSDVCYGENGRLREDMRKPAPVGEDCALCAEPIEPGTGHDGIMSILGFAALGAALTAIVIGALTIFEVIALDGADMLAVLFILAGTVWLSGVVGGHVTLPASLGRKPR